MKAQMLKMAGVKTEAAFYKKYPTQEAFMKAHGKAFEKAQFGNMFDKGFNPGNTQTPSSIGFTPMSTSLTSSGFEMPDGIKNIAGKALTSKLPGSIPNMKVPDSIGGATSKIPGAGQILGAATGIIGAVGAFKQQKNKLQGIRQQKGVADVSLQAKKTIDVDAARQRQDSAAKAREAIMQPIDPSSVSPINGVGTNILAKEGTSVKGKPKKGKKVDVRKETDVIRIPSNVNAGETQYVRTTKSLKGLGKRDTKLQQESTDDFVDWYSDPETKKRFAKNTGMDPARLQDFIGKALRTPMKEYDSAKVNDYPLDGNAEAVFRSPYYNESVGDKSHPKTGYIMHRPQGNDIPELSSYATNMSSAIQHELAHASGLDNVLGNALFRAMDKKPVTKDQKGNLSYMDRPEELYGHFHEFRTGLGLKPGQKVTREELKKKVEDNKRVNSTSRFWQYESSDDKTGEQSDKEIDKIVNAINTVAYNPNNDDNVTYAQDGAEIQNTYAPGTLYDDLGYEPLEDSAQVKQYKRGGFVKAQGGFSSFMGGGGTDFANKMVGNAFGNNAGSQMGSAIGGALKMIPGVGSVAGAIAAPVLGAIGGLADNVFGSAGKIKKQQAALDRTMGDIANVDQAKDIQAQNASYMEDGGYVSNNWTPQVIAKFGDHSPEDVYDFAHEGMDSLRAGGHLRSYREPSEEAMESYAMGGELKTHWGGHMEEMSENPYLPGDGVTYMPHGQSHDESDGEGRTGIGITYGDNPVEVERREPIMKLKDGSTGEDNMVVFGNLEIPKYGVEMLGDKKAKGMKFKNYVSDLSKSEVKQNKTIQKSAEELADLTPRTSFDKLKFAGLEANVLGGNMKLKEIAETKQKAAALQNAINDTAEEMGVDADSLAKGKVKMAKMGGKFTKAQFGKSVDKRLDKYKVDFGPNASNPSAIQLNEVKIPKTDYMRKELTSLSPKGMVQPDMTPRGSVIPESAGEPLDAYVSSDEEEDDDSEDSDFDFNKLTPYMNAINDLIPMLRPSDAEPLNTNQLYGEMYALSNNKEEPVQAQLYNPQLARRSRISLQDTMNDITAQTRAAQRMAQGNPTAQAAIAAQAYSAIDKVRGEEFRMNQAGDDQLNAANINTLNTAKLKNLEILDNQYTRQAAAKSNTKAINQAALSSISDKYAKNNLDNRKLKTYENTYNYRYDDEGRAINMNPLAQWNTSGTASGNSRGKGLAPGYEFTYDANQNIIGTRRASNKGDAKNGSIVKAMRNL